MKILSAVLLTILLAGCGNSVTGSNAELDVVHTGGPDCTQSGCHPGFGAAGTVFVNRSGLRPVSGMEVKAGTILIGTTDNLGNFYYEGTLSGNFQMTVGSRQSQIYLHKLPHDSGCNSCHKWPPSGDPMPLGSLH